MVMAADQIHGWSDGSLKSIGTGAQDAEATWLSGGFEQTIGA